MAIQVHQEFHQKQNVRVVKNTMHHLVGTSSYICTHCIMDIAFQNTSSKVSGHDKNISTTSSGFSSKNLAIEMSLKDEAFGM